MKRYHFTFACVWPANDSINIVFKENRFKSNLSIIAKSRNICKIDHIQSYKKSDRIILFSRFKHLANRVASLFWLWWSYVKKICTYDHHIQKRRFLVSSVTNDDIQGVISFHYIRDDVGNNWRLQCKYF